MKTSVYIPTDNLSVDNLINIVTSYNNGLVAPDEIVINVDGVTDNHSLEILRSIQQLEYDNTTIYARKTVGSVADNRNYAKRLTTGDIVLFHSPKTIPSYTRVNLIKHFFEHFDVLVVNHTLSYNVDRGIDGDMFEGVIYSEDLYKRYFPFNNRENAWQFTRTYGQEFGVENIDHESICVRREVIENVSWKNDFQYELYRGNKDGSCYEFELDTLYKYNKSEIINFPLTIVNK